MGIGIDENIGTESERIDGPYVNVTMYFEALEGRTPAQGPS
jgi:hypothetical protein